LLDVVRLSRTDTLIPKLGKDESLRDDAWRYYKAWRADAESCRNPALGRILVNRVGWKHMTRRGRLPERIVQSWTLLGAAKKIVTGTRKVFSLGHVRTTRFPDGNSLMEDFLGLRAVVYFPHRHHSVIQVVLKRSRLLCPKDQSREREKIWFYSVYELRRGGETSV
jgi:hypothetical protein